MPTSCQVAASHRKGRAVRMGLPAAAGTLQAWSEGAAEEGCGPALRELGRGLGACSRRQQDRDRQGRGSGPSGG